MGGFSAQRPYSRGRCDPFQDPIRTLFCRIYRDEHPADGQYLEDIESERPSVQAQARELWLRTENLWTLFPDFIAALRR